MAQAKSGDVVTVNYAGKLKDGTIFDSSVDGPPLQFTIGESKILPAFEKAVVGMKPGGSKIVKIPAAQAYGPYRRELLVELERNDFPGDVKLEVGTRLRIPRSNGDLLLTTVTKVTESKVTLDANHPLAGKDLIFDIQLVEVS